MLFDMHIGVQFAVCGLSISGSYFMFHEDTILAVGISPLPEIVPQRLAAGTGARAQRARTTLYCQRSLVSKHSEGRTRRLNLS